MIIELKITAETAAELNDAISGLHSQMYQNPVEDKPDETKTEPVKRTRSKAEKQQDLVKDTKDEVILKEPEITLEEIRAMLAEKAESGKRTEAKELLTKFGASKLPALDVARYAEFVAELKNL